MKKILTLSLICFTVISKADYWTQKANFGGGLRGWATAFSIGSKGYVGCGADFNDIFKKDFWEYDQFTNIWTQKADFGGTAREGSVGFSIGNKGYFGTGWDSINLKRDFWEYDPAVNIWIQKADFGGMERWGAVGFSIGIKGYIGTGRDLFSTYYQDLWEWDQTSNVWIQKADMSGGRFLATGFSIGTKGYIGNGIHPGGLLNDFWEWDQGNNIWTQKANYGGTPRCEASGFVIGNYGYITTGSTDWGFVCTDDMWKYNPAVNLWTQGASFGGGIREMEISFSIGCNSYFGTGWINDLSPHDDFWEYTPDSCFTGMNELEDSDLNFGLLYNPVNEFLVINYPSIVKEKISVMISGVNGKIILQTQSTINNHQSSISIRDLSSGIYFVEATDGKQRAVRKFVKE
jgi:hypothetical protein